MSTLIYNSIDQSFTYNNKTVYDLFKYAPFDLDKEQIQHFIVDLFDEFIRQRTQKDFKIAVKRAGTNTGKTTCYPYFIKLLMEFGLVNTVLVTTASLGVLSESEKSIKELFRKALFNGDVVRPYGDIDDAIKDTYAANKIVLIGTQSVKNAVDNKKLDKLSPELIIIDEVHENFATSHSSDAKLDMGAKNVMTLERLKAIKKALKKEISIIALTGTTSPSQEGDERSIHGHETYAQIGQAYDGKEEHNRGIRDNPILVFGIDDAVEQSAVRVFNRQKNRQAIVSRMSSAVKRVLSGNGLKVFLPRNALVACGGDMKTAKNSINIAKAKAAIERAAITTNTDRFNVAVFETSAQASVLYQYDNGVVQSQESLADYGTPSEFADTFLNPDTKPLGDEESKFLEGVTFMLVVYKGNSGENIYNVSDLIFARKSTLVEIFRREQQLIGRIKRQFPGVRSHKTLLSDLKNYENAPSLSSVELDDLRDFLVETAVADVYYAFDSVNAESATKVTMKTSAFDERGIENLYDTELYGLTKTSHTRHTATIDSSDITDGLKFPKRVESSVILDSETIEKKSSVKPV